VNQRAFQNTSTTATRELLYLRQAINVDVAIVGAGIVGLAHAYLAARAGHRVAVFERNPVPMGASLRNFGMIWPIGQSAGQLHRFALRSRTLWLEVLRQSKTRYRETGSIHAAYSEQEAAVAFEFSSKAPALGYDCEWLSPEQALACSHALVSEGLAGALWSPTEFTVDPRQLLSELPGFLSEQFGVTFYFNSPVQRVEPQKLKTPEFRCEAEHIVVAGGDDFQTLFPEHFRRSGVSRCKLQMMRTISQPEGWLLGPSLAFGLTFLHYPAFEICDSRAALKAHLEQTMPEFFRYGIHVLVSQSGNGQLTVGDSHEYGLDVSPFDDSAINDLILEYARARLKVPRLQIAEQWHGVYAWHSDHPWLFFTPCEGVRVLTVTRGNGMTMSFGLAEQTLLEMGVSL
jgi:FAD dependent oxidoreductase TIGR03364